MTRLFRRRSKKLGAPPGSLIYTGDAIAEPTGILALIYDKDLVIEKSPASIEEALKLPQEGKQFWLHITGISDPRVIDAIGRKFKLHPLLLEDIMSPSQRSKLDDYKDFLYIATRILHVTTPGNGTLEDEQLSIVFGDNFLLSFVEKDTALFQPIRDRLKKPTSKMRNRGPDYLAYAILDSTVDHYFLALEGVDKSLEKLEEELLDNPEPSTLNKILKIKREMALLRKIIWPMREVINHFRRTDSPLIEEGTQMFSNDVYDHTIQAIETVESFRDITSGMIDIYLSTINQRMNEIMKVLTIVATIFVPLTFITSLYGMNFKHMPELDHPLGYFYVLGFMALLSLFMLYCFRRKKWI
jgi:magnesium transporter